MCITWYRLTLYGVQMAAGICLVATNALFTLVHGHKVSNLDGQGEKDSTYSDTPVCKCSGRNTKNTSLQNAAGMSPFWHFLVLVSGSLISKSFGVLFRCLN